MSSQLCIECGRDFKSSKALHGHLRCHPERNYRGTNPTSRRNFSRQKRKVMGSGGGASGPATSSSSAVQEPLFVQPLSWCPSEQTPLSVKKVCTHVRRCPSDASSTYNLSTPAAATTSSLSATHKALQGNRPPQPHISHDLPHLPHKICITNSLSQATDSQSDEPSTNSSSSSAMQEPFLWIDNQPADQIVVSSAYNLLLEANLKQGTDSTSDRAGTKSSITLKESFHKSFHKGLTKKRKIAEGFIHRGKDQIHTKRGSSCNICSKFSDSYQALEHHMPSHLNKSKAIVSRSDKATGHPCNICGEIYPTGQALGGHKRKHWEAPQPLTHPQPAPQPQPENYLPGFLLFGTWISV